MEYSLGYITFPSKTEAKKIILALLEEKLIACANIFSGAESFFAWEGKIDRSKEAAAFIKTRPKNHSSIVKMVKKMHSYQCPCVVFTPIEDGNREFLAWIEEEC